MKLHLYPHTMSHDIAAARAASLINFASGIASGKIPLSQAKSLDDESLEMVLANLKALKRSGSFDGVLRDMADDANFINTPSHGNSCLIYAILKSADTRVGLRDEMLQEYNRVTGSTARTMPSPEEIRKQIAVLLRRRIQHFKREYEANPAVYKSDKYFSDLDDMLIKEALTEMFLRLDHASILAELFGIFVVCIDTTQTQASSSYLQIIFPECASDDSFAIANRRKYRGVAISFLCPPEDINRELLGHFSGISLRRAAPDFDSCILAQAQILAGVLDAHSVKRPLLDSAISEIQEILAKRTQRQKIIAELDGTIARSICTMERLWTEYMKTEKSEYLTKFSEIADLVETMKSQRIELVSSHQ